MDHKLFERKKIYLIYQKCYTDFILHNSALFDFPSFGTNEDEDCGLNLIRA